MAKNSLRNKVNAMAAAIEILTMKVQIQQALEDAGLTFYVEIGKNTIETDIKLPRGLRIHYSIPSDKGFESELECVVASATEMVRALSCAPLFEIKQNVEKIDWQTEVNI